MIADLTLTCVACGEEFVFSSDEQGFYQGQGFKSAPKRCRSCRRARKTGEAARPDRRRSRPNHQVNCSGCGAPTLVPFVPDPMRPAFCRGCYQQRKRR